MFVEMEKDMAEDLIHFKLSHIQEEIELILTRWNETSATDFLEKARNGVYRNAENDAIDLHQLIADAQLLRKKLTLIGF